MHHNLTLILPPMELDRVEAAVAAILKPFDENHSDPEYYGGDGRNKHAFWDWYVIGGRYSTRLIQSKLDPQKLEEFSKQVEAMKVRVSPVVVGNEKLVEQADADAIDNLWNTMFPESGLTKCPFFEHGLSQYHNTIDRDTMPLGEVPVSYKSYGVMIANRAGTEAEFLVQHSQYNGVCYIDTAWDQTLGDALRLYADKIQHYKDEWRAANTPTNDWLVVTVDYHN